MPHGCRRRRDTHPVANLPAVILIGPCALLLTEGLTESARAAIMVLTARRVLGIP